jgi:hypothetical protein
MMALCAAFLAESPKKWQLAINQLLREDPADVERCLRGRGWACGPEIPSGAIYGLLAKISKKDVGTSETQAQAQRGEETFELIRVGTPARIDRED